MASGSAVWASIFLLVRSVHSVAMIYVPDFGRIDMDTRHRILISLVMLVSLPYAAGAQQAAPPRILSVIPERPDAPFMSNAIPDYAALARMEDQAGNRCASDRNGLTKTILERFPGRASSLQHSALKAAVARATVSCGDLRQIRVRKITALASAIASGGEPASSGAPAEIAATSRQIAADTAFFQDVLSRLVSR